MAKKAAKKKLLENLAEEAAEIIEQGTKKSAKKVVTKVVKQLAGTTMGTPTFKSFRNQLQTLEKEGYTQELLASGGGVLPNIGIRLPSICLEALFSSTVLPFGRLLLIGGPKGSFKTLFSLELAKWFRDVGGKANIAENENKLEKRMVDSHLGDRVESWFRMQFCDSLNMSQSVLTAFRRDYIARSKNGEYLPELDVLDSVQGHASDEQIKKVEDEGFASRGFSDGARMTAAYLGTYMPYFLQVPCFSTFITHGVEEEKSSVWQPAVRRYKGANEMLFKASYVLFFKRRDKKSEESEDGTEVYGTIILDKATGATGIRLPVIVRFGHDIYSDETGRRYYKSVSYFDWHESTVTMLVEPDKCGIAPSVCRAIKDIIKIRYERGKLICPEVGLTPDKPGTSKQLVEAIWKDEIIYSSLKELLGISDGIVYDGSTPFVQLRKDAIDQALNKVSSTAINYSKLTRIHTLGDRDG